MNQSHFDTSMSEYSAFLGGALAFVMSFMSGGDIFEAFIIGAIGYTGAIWVQQNSPISAFFVRSISSDLSILIVLSACNAPCSAE